MMHDCSEAPEISGFTIRLKINNFGRYIFGGPQNRLGIGMPCKYLRHAKVNNINISLCIQQKILWFEVPVNDVVIMEMSKAE